MPALALAPVLERVRDTLAKVYADKALVFNLDCAPTLAWRIDEGDAFELLGNLMDNAAKWARQRVAVSARREGDRLLLRIDGDGPGFGTPEPSCRSMCAVTSACPGTASAWP